MASTIALYTNNATTTLASGINNVVTSLSVSAGTGALFPSPTGTDYFYCTLADAATGNVIEIVKVTSRAVDTFTIVRAQQGTSASAYLAGDKVELRPTASGFSELAALAGTAAFTQLQTFNAGITVTGNITGTLATAAQPNVTSVGTLTSVTSSGAISGTTGAFTKSDTNAVEGVTITNANAGNATYAALTLSNGTNTGFFGIAGTGAVTVGSRAAGWNYMYSDLGFAMQVATGKTVAIDVNNVNITTVSSTGLAVTGTLTLNSYAAGSWTTPAYNAGDFTGAGSQTWTVDSGDVITYEYTVIYKTMHLVFKLNATSVGGTPNVGLNIKVPGGYTVAKQAQTAILTNDNLGGWSMGTATVNSGATVVLLTKDATQSANWSASTNQTYVSGEITFEIQ